MGAKHRSIASRTLSGAMPSAGLQVASGRQTMSWRRLSISAVTVQNGAATRAAVPRLTSGVGTASAGTRTRKSPAAREHSLSRRA